MQEDKSDQSNQVEEETVLATTAECNYCGWQGSILDTKFENGTFYCPSCNQEFGPPAHNHDHDEELE